MYNKVILMGRITKDIELKTTSSGTSVVSFSLAVERKYQADKSNKVTDFHNCVAWRQTAEFLENYFSKGNMIMVEGELQNRKYTDKNGVERTVTEVIVSDVSFTGEKSGTGGGSAVSHGAPPVASTPAPVTTSPAAAASSGTDDDYPF